MILNLLQQFYTPKAGEIKIDGYNIKELDIDWLRNQIGFVSQELSIFATTVRLVFYVYKFQSGTYINYSVLIRENIRLGKLDATDFEIETAAKSANAHKFIMNTPYKYETLIGERY